MPTWYHDDPRRGVVRNLYFAAALWPDSPSDYGTIARFPTNRFQNLTTRTVAFFDPDHPERNDYRPGYHTLLVWGRAAFVEFDGAQALPFFMFIPLDQLRGDPTAVQLRPRFFAGYDARGKPRWSESELDAQPIYGTDAKLVEADGVKLDWREPELDYVSQSSLSWVAPLRRWVMLYGGDLPAFPLLRSSGRAKDPVHLPFAPGAIHMRLAAHPWGAAERTAAGGGWTSPEPVLTRNAAARYLACGDDGPKGLAGCQERGDPHGPFDLVSTLAGLMVRDPGKLGDVAGSCIAGEFIHAVQDEFSGDPIGRLYGVNVIEEWTEEITDPQLTARGERVAEVYWNVSTWNPYQVILVKTRLSAR